MLDHERRTSSLTDRKQIICKKKKKKTSINSVYLKQFNNYANNTDIFFLYLFLHKNLQGVETEEWKETISSVTLCNYFICSMSL